MCVAGWLAGCVDVQLRVMIVSQLPSIHSFCWPLIASLYSLQCFCIMCVSVFVCVYILTYMMPNIGWKSLMS